jgi:hypothetical protein
MDEVAVRLDTIAGLRVWAWPPGSVTPPAAVVSYPETYTFDETYGRGMDRITLPVVVVVGVPTERQTRDLLGQYCDGSGAASLKAVLESGTYTAFDTIRVVDIDFDTVTIGGVEHVAALFTLDIAGSGSS